MPGEMARRRAIRWLIPVTVLLSCLAIGFMIGEWSQSELPAVTVVVIVFVVLAS